MDLVFSTDDYAPDKRYSAWRDAICDVYVNVDVKATNPDSYRGFIRETKFGEVALTDILLSEQRIRRKRQHISRLDKECYYLQILHTGSITVVQRDEALKSNAARGALFSAAEEYELHGHGEVRSFYLELPRDEFAQRFDRAQIPVSATLNTTQGLGRIAAEFCAALATEGPRLAGDLRDGLGNQLMDLLAFSLQAAEGDVPGSDGSIRAVRLRSVQQWIEENLSNPNLSLDRVAQANEMSLRYLHVLFEGSDMSPSEWIWNRRLQLAYDCLSRGDGRTITTVAYDHGFSSSAHFSTAFRRRFGFSPRDLIGS